MEFKPTISVCIPTYNGERFIAATLESVLSQTFNDFEVIVVDDGSTDKTVSVVKGFGDCRIKVIQNSRNLGMGQNWNKALSYARGKYVKIVCEDDVLAPECLSRQVEVLEDPQHSNVVLAVCNRAVIDSKGRVILRRKLPFRRGEIAGKKLIHQCVRAGMNLIGEPVVGLFRRAALRNTAPCSLSNTYLLDLLLWAELLKQGDAFFDSRCLAGFRISEGAMSTRIGWSQSEYFRDFIQTLRTDAHYQIGLGDAASGRVFSVGAALLRNAFLRFYLTRAKLARRLVEPRASGERRLHSAPV